MDSFIRAYDDVLEAEELKKIIKRFNEISEESSVSGERQFKTSLGRKDQSIMIEDHSPHLAGEIHNSIQSYLNDYLELFPGGKELNLQGYNVKMQRTEPGGGYHVWHSEQGGIAAGSARRLVWSLYMNDIAEGGETEFLNQTMRIQPKAGRLAIWPAAWPWQHRGNPPLVGVKYICTGWWYEVFLA